jgi:lipopolysaccharide/colanic/teichoic acid biosynthesis glycosyltransferase
MSLVGPRPLLMEYLPLYTPRQAHRHDVRPGITGLAQVSGETDWDARLALDVQYAAEHTLALDLRILARTAGAVLHRDGHPGRAMFAGSEG